VVTGGEPTLYPLDYLCDELRKRGIQTFIETSGAYPLTGQWDWICLSPKSQQPPVEGIHMMADELKVIISSPDDFEWAEKNAAKVKATCQLFLQSEWSVYKTMIPIIVDTSCSIPNEVSCSAQVHENTLMREKKIVQFKVQGLP
jgi:organic radical activating enzyme